MAYNVELSESADRELSKLDGQHRKRILKFLHERVAKLDNPRSIGEALHGSQLGADMLDRVFCELGADRLGRSLVVLVFQQPWASRVAGTSGPKAIKGVFLHSVFAIVRMGTGAHRGGLQHVLISGPPESCGLFQLFAR